jgi:hypothetical protein
MSTRKKEDGTIAAMESAWSAEKIIIEDMNKVSRC